MPDQPDPTTVPYATVPFDLNCLEMLANIRNYYWERSNQALDSHDADGFTAWNRRAKQVTNVIATVHEVQIRDREAWVASQTARLAALDGKAPADDA